MEVIVGLIPLSDPQSHQEDCQPDSWKVWHSEVVPINMVNFLIGKCFLVKIQENG